MSLVFLLCPRFGLVLFIADVFHPFDSLILERLLNCDMRQSCRCRGPVPVLHTRRDPDNVAFPDSLDRLAPLLDQAGTVRYDQYLARTGGYAMPSGRRARK